MALDNEGCWQILAQHLNDSWRPRGVKLVAKKIVDRQVHVGLLSGLKTSWKVDNFSAA
jgi:hypothetical protein